MNFSETYWFLAEAHQLMANAVRERNAVDVAARLQKQAMEWLARIKAGSPRFQQAQAVLAEGPKS